jgi:AbrB family looped-hinge helix DNA binding protein
MTTAILSPKFQIVIPKEIRNKLELKPGQRISVTEKDGHIELTPVLPSEQIVGLLSDCAHIEFEREPDRELP